MAGFGVHDGPSVPSEAGVFIEGAGVHDGTRSNIQDSATSVERAATSCVPSKCATGDPRTGSSEIRHSAAGSAVNQRIGLKQSRTDGSWMWIEVAGRHARNDHKSVNYGVVWLNRAARRTKNMIAVVASQWIVEGIIWI